MQYKIIVDKQSRTNPSTEKKEYIIDIEELRYKGNVYDSLVITKDEDYVMRRLELTEYHVLNVLQEPIKQPIKNLNIELFEGDNYIYLIDMTGNRFFAEYIIKNEFTDTYITKAEFNSGITQTAKQIELSVNEKLIGYSKTEEMNSTINQAAKNIELSVNQKLTGYSTTKEMNAAIKLEADSINTEVSKKIGEDEFATYLQQNPEAVKIAWNKISEFIQMEILNNNASIAIRDSAKNLLMALNKSGQHFYEDNNKNFADMGVVEVKDGDYKGLMFVLEGTNTGTSILPNNNFMGFGYKVLVNGAETVMPFMYLGKAYSDDENILHIASDVEVQGTMTAHIIKNLTSLYANYAEFGEVKGDYIHANSIEADNIINTITTSSIYSDGYLASFNNKDGTRLTLYADTSDKRMKKNIKKSTKKALDYIKSIKHFSYDWKLNNENVDIGYIAQELEKINPQFVRKRTYGENQEEYEIQVNTLNLLATTTKAIQEQQEQIEILKKEIEKLKGGKHE